MGVPCRAAHQPRSGPQVVERCLELGAASARYISGSMDSPSLPEEVLREAENTWGRCWELPHPTWQPPVVASGKPALPPGGLDMLILNHIGQSGFTFFNGDVGHVRKLLETNFVSYVALATAALPMLKESEGSIVVVSSIAGELRAPAHSPSPACQGSC